MYGFVAPSFTYGHPHVSPEELYGTLFRDVQNSHIFADSKTFADAIPLEDPVLIIERYHQEKDDPDFDLAISFSRYFRMPVHIASAFQADTSIVHIGAY